MNHPHPIDSISRRQFVHRASIGAAILASPSQLARAAAGANERIRIGMIGVGGRGSALLADILGQRQKKNVEIAALCDVYRKNLDAAAQRVRQSQGGSEPARFSRYQDLLAFRDLDAVTIATPDFSHGTLLVAALQARKDVYVEKPMTIDLEHANQAFDLARANQCVVQAGTQRRSEGKFISAAKMIAQGALGTLNRIAAAYYVNQARWKRQNDPCTAADVDWDAYLLHLPKRPFNASLLREWQLHRETSNGMPGLWMTHYADATSMLTGARYPSSAVAHGGTYVWKDGREHADTFYALVDYPEGFLFNWGMGLGNAAGIHWTLHGTLGTIDMEKATFTPERPKAQPAPLPPEPSLSHMGQWLDCIRTRQRPNADIQFGHQHVVATVMCARALETGQRQTYNPASRLILPG
ncbi:MAG TPA: Gfo/Idh/MocA family oxidoreductase [Candidatus Paceibacterota bacterium]|nr:Gfo/Idh/MocA family oxidoreductase [Verrucomicrobiota bacterium]HRZ45758.1 Gfo/Idh/MocA family oxidoreductase [Candidatus Paceibacterota bacterium]